jgi:hypothetical protein
LEAAYLTGPLRIIRTVYSQHTPDGTPYGRPTFWVAGGWRCSNGAGGAACYSAKRSSFNQISVVEVMQRFAVTADTR